MGRLVIWLFLAALGAALVAVFFDGLQYVVQSWGRDEYSYGYIVPPIAAWLVWQRLKQSEWSASNGSWTGLLIVVFAVLVAALASLGGMPTAIFYSLILTLFGLFVAAVGWRTTWFVLPALAYLFFALPLPQTLFIKLSTTLQMVSSELGVAFMRAFGVSVFLEGNIIDLGVYQLQVAEACSGLGYLFPLASFAYLIAYLYRGPMWHKVLLVLSSVPITIAINSFRIGIIGILVNSVGIEAAEGFLHWFEGYAIFLVGAVLFICVMWLLARLGGHRGSVWSMIRFEAIWPTGGESPRQTPSSGARTLARPLIASFIVLVLGTVAAQAMPRHEMTVPDRMGLAAFPMRMDEWRGREGRIEDNFLAVLRLDDYVMADFYNPDWDNPVNLYIAYYEAQTQSNTIHSPDVCIPAAGWEITNLGQHAVADVPTASGSLVLNRATIVKGLSRQLVYYWFEQRGRQLTSEHLIKALNIWDGLTRNRTDGALVRFTTSVSPGEDMSAADRRLEALVRQVAPRLPKYVPH